MTIAPNDDAPASTVPTASTASTVSTPPTASPGDDPSPPDAGDGKEATTGELRPWRAGAAVMAVVVLVAVAATAVALRPGDDARTGSVVTMMGGGAMPAGLRAGCEQWVAGRGPSGVPGTVPAVRPGAMPGAMPGGVPGGVPGGMPGGMRTGGAAASQPDATWCASMTTWMTDQVARGQGRASMWQTPEAMAASCRQWLGSGTTAGTTIGAMPGGAGMDPAWCDEMVTWMKGHMGRWSGA